MPSVSVSMPFLGYYRINSIPSLNAHRSLSTRPSPFLRRFKQNQLRRARSSLNCCSQTRTSSRNHISPRVDTGYSIPRVFRYGMCPSLPGCYAGQWSAFGHPLKRFCNRTFVRCLEMMYCYRTEFSHRRTVI